MRGTFDGDGNVHVAFETFPEKIVFLLINSSNIRQFFEKSIKKIDKNHVNRVNHP